MRIRGRFSYKDLVKSLICSEHSVDVLVIKNPSLKGESSVSKIEDHGGCGLYKQGEFPPKLVKT